MNSFFKKKPISKKAGFTLIELMVSLSIFSLVMVISMGSILSVLDANRKSQTMRNIMDNLNFAIEGMTRNIRFGQDYHCGSTGNLSNPRDCQSGDTSITVLTSSGSTITYGLLNGRISRTVNNGAVAYITPTDVTIQSITFWVVGSDPYNNGANTSQPKAIIVIKGYASLGQNVLSRSKFSIQTTASQRKLDFQ